MELLLVTIEYGRREDPPQPIQLPQSLLGLEDLATELNLMEMRSLHSLVKLLRQL